jgi:hypothetical protein
VEMLATAWSPLRSSGLKLSIHESARPQEARFPRVAGKPGGEGSRLFAAVDSFAVWVPGVSLGGGDLLVEGVGVGLLVFDSVEVLAV